MSAWVVVLIIAALVVLAVGAFVATARRHDTRRGEGALSRETRKRDRSRSLHGADRGTAGRAHRQGGRAAPRWPSARPTLVPVTSSVPAPVRPT